MNENLSVGPGGWSSITVAISSGTSTLRAQVVGPFAVHRERGRDTWRVTHLRTGCAFARFDDYRTAAKYASRLRAVVSAQLIDTANPAAARDHLKAVGALEIRNEMKGDEVSGRQHPALSREPTL